MNERNKMIIKPDESESTLDYADPCAFTSNLIKLTAIMPETHLLFITPPVCAHKRAVDAVNLGIRKKVSYYIVNEADIISGNFNSILNKAVDKLMHVINPAPKAVMICQSCADCLIRTDYELDFENLEKRYNIPFRLVSMSTIDKDTRGSVDNKRSAYTFLSKSGNKVKGVNIVGSTSPIDKGSEIYKLLEDKGYQIRHISDCKTFEEFKTLSQSSCNLVIRPGGKKAAKWMEENLGIPWCYIPVSYSVEEIKKQYEKIEKSLGVELDILEYCNNAEKLIKEKVKLINEYDVSIESVAVCRPFDMALAFKEYGLTIKTIYASATVYDSDIERFEQVQKHIPDLEIKSFRDHDMYSAGGNTDKKNKIIGIGTRAGYYSQTNAVYPLYADETIFGFQGLLKVLDGMTEAVRISEEGDECIGYGRVF